MEASSTSFPARMRRPRARRAERRQCSGTSRGGGRDLNPTCRRGRHGVENFSEGIGRCAPSRFSAMNRLPRQRRKHLALNLVEVFRTSKVAELGAHRIGAVRGAGAVFRGSPRMAVSERPDTICEGTW
jgi:hypothetical protein